MKKFCERTRKVTTFLLAAFLWLHALFLLNFQLIPISKYTAMLRLTTSEAVLFGLLFVFSLIAASGFWKMVLSLVYIYLFPFVLLAYALYGCFRIIRAMNKWFHSQAMRLEGSALLSEQKALTITQVIPSSQGSMDQSKEDNPSLLSFLFRPFQRFMILWCVLLILTTHTAIVWMCLFVVLAHLGWRLFNTLRILFIFDLWLGKFAQSLANVLDPVIAALASVSHDVDRTKDLENLWNQAKTLRKTLDFLKNPYLVSRWAWVLGVAFMGSIYIYFAALFSFAYYGIARVNGVSFSWPDALVASIFIPFFTSELPKLLAAKVLGGIQCTLVLAVGLGTIMKFLRHRLDAICKAASDASDRFADVGIHDKYVILEEKFTANVNATPPAQGLTN